MPLPRVTIRLIDPDWTTGRSFRLFQLHCTFQLYDIASWLGAKRKAGYFSALIGRKFRKHPRTREPMLDLTFAFADERLATMFRMSFPRG